MKIKKNEFQCNNCKGIFNKAWTDEQAMEEADMVWGELGEDPAIICDDCFKELYEFTFIKTV